MTGPNEAFSRVLIDKALEASGWDLLSAQQVSFELNTSSGRVDYLLKDRLGRVLCVLEAKRESLDPYDAKEQARGYAENLHAPLVILSNGREHWFWNYERADQRDAFRIERLPSLEDLERVRLKNLQPPRPLQTESICPEYLRALRPDLTLRGYQIRAMEEVAKGYDDSGRRGFLLEMATGTGKTLLCAALIRRFLVTRNAERVLFIVDRIELAKQTMEDFNVVLGEYKPVIYKTARRTGELLGSSVVVATIQSLMTDRRYREEFTPFYFDLVVNDEAHRSIYGDAREAVQFFQATRIGLTATPKAYLKNVNLDQLASEDPKALEARQLRDTYHYFGCEPGEPTFRYDIIDAVKDTEGPFLCLPKIVDCRSDITTQALQEAGWTVVIKEQEENFKIQDLERKVFTPHRNRVMCEAFLREAQRDPTGEIGKSIVFAVNQTHATALTKVLNEIRPGIALTITSRIADASSQAKEFRDGKRPERIAVSVDTRPGATCRTSASAARCGSRRPTSPRSWSSTVCRSARPGTRGSGGARITPERRLLQSVRPPFTFTFPLFSRMSPALALDSRRAAPEPRWHPAKRPASDRALSVVRPKHWGAEGPVDTTGWRGGAWHRRNPTRGKVSARSLESPHPGPRKQVAREDGPAPQTPPRSAALMP